MGVRPRCGATPSRCSASRSRCAPSAAPATGISTASTPSRLRRWPATLSTGSSSPITRNFWSSPELIRDAALPTIVGAPLPVSNTSIYLKSSVLGDALHEEHFELRETALRPPADGEVLLETLCLSVDPYIRGCMTGMPNYYLPQLDLRAPIHSLGAARILDSRLPGFTAEDLVVADIAWPARPILSARMIAWRPAGGATRRRPHTTTA